MKKIQTMLLILVAFAPACKKDSGAGAASQTLKQYLSGASQYTLYYKALQRAGLDTLLGGVIPYTVFAVSDSGMQQSGYTPAGIDTASIAQLRGALQYQLIPGNITSATLQLYKETPVITEDSGYQTYLEDNNFGLFFNGIPVVGVDSGLSNGVVQQLQTMAAPPIGDLVTTIGKIPSLSDYSFTIHQITKYGSSFGSYLQPATATSPLTIFIPDNAFYAQVGLDNPVAIEEAGYGSTPAYSWANGPYFINDFLGGSNLYCYTDGFGNTYYLWFARDGYSFYPGGSSSPHYQIVRANIICTNGVIHIIQPYSN